MLSLLRERDLLRDDSGVCIYCYIRNILKVHSALPVCFTEIKLHGLQIISIYQQLGMKTAWSEMIP